MTFKDLEGVDADDIINERCPKNSLINYIGQD